MTIVSVEVRQDGYRLHLSCGHVVKVGRDEIERIENGRIDCDACG